MLFHIHANERVTLSVTVCHTLRHSSSPLCPLSPPPPPNPAPHSSSCNCFQWRTLLQKIPHGTSMDARNKLGEAVLAKRRCTRSQDLCGSLLMNARWSWHTTFHKPMREQTASNTSELLSVCPSSWAACFLTQWLHSSGPAQYERSSPKSSQSFRAIKRIKRRKRKNHYCLVSKNAKTGTAFDWDWLHVSLIGVPVKHTDL